MDSPIRLTNSANPLSKLRHLDGVRVVIYTSRHGSEPRYSRATVSKNLV